MNPFKRFASISIASLSCVIFEASAATYVVDKNGTGDFTTIQAAVNQIAATETTGAVRGYAYFTRGSDFVYISGGLSALSVGMLISVDDRNWYEITEIVDSQNIRISRAYSENNRFNSYKAVEVAEILIRPGVYSERVNLQGVHFVRFSGSGSSREEVIIQPAKKPVSGGPATNLYNVQDFGAVYFENLTARNVFSGSPIMTTMGEGADVPAPSDMNLSLKNIHFDDQCCDVIYSPYGHVVIEDSKLEGENDVLGGYFKSLTVKRSEIMSQRSLALFGAGKAIFVKLLYDSLVENSLIFTRSVSGIPWNSAGGSGTAIYVATNGSTLVIRNTFVAVDGTTSATALNLSGGTDRVSIEGSRLIARGDGSIADILMDSTDNVTLKCSEFVTVGGGGVPNVLSCP